MTRSLLLLSLLLAVCATAVSASGVVSGRLSSLSGEVEKGAVVRAFSWDATTNTLGAQAVEEATTDAHGEYKLTKLQDGQAYRVVVKSVASGDADSKIVRATPEWHLVRASAAPVTALNFVAFRRAAKFDLTGEIVGLASSPAGAGGVLKHLSTLEVSVALASNPAVVVASTKTLSPNQGFFAFYNLPAESYVLSVKTSLSTRTYSFSSHPLQINLREGSVHVQPVVDIGFRSSSVAEMQGNSLWNGLLIVAALAAILYKERSIDLLKATVKSVQVRNPAPIVAAVSALFGARGSSSSSFAAPSASGESESKKKSSKFPAKKEKTHVSTFVKTDRTPLAPTPVVEEPVAAVSKRSAPVQEKEKPVRAAQSLAAPAPKPHRVATPAPAAAPSPAATPSPPPQVVATPEPQKVVSPKPVKAQKEKATKPAPVAAAAAAAPAPVPVVAAAAAPVPAPAAAASSSGTAKFCSEVSPSRARCPCTHGLSLLPLSPLHCSSPNSPSLSWCVLLSPPFLFQCGHKRGPDGGKFCAEVSGQGHTGRQHVSVLRASC